MVLPQSETSDRKSNNGDTGPFSLATPTAYPHPGPLRNPFPPIADYAFLSDCETQCLISSAGSVEWL